MEDVGDLLPELLVLFDDIFDVAVFYFDVVDFGKD